MPFRTEDRSPRLKLDDGVGGPEVERRSASRLLFSSLARRLSDRDLGRRMTLSHGVEPRLLDGGGVKEMEGFGEPKTKDGGGVDGAVEGASMDGMGSSGTGTELVLALPLLGTPVWLGIGQWRCLVMILVVDKQ